MSKTYFNKNQWDALEVKYESRTQKACVRWFDTQYPKLEKVLFAIPNDSKRNPKQGMELKRKGMRRGVADLFLSIANHGYHGLYIEMKKPKEEQTADQKKFQADVERMGYRYVIISSIDGFITMIQSYLNGTPYHKAVWRQLPFSDKNPL